MGQLATLGRVATRVSHFNSFTTIWYHNTPVVRFNDEVIILEAGGWFTKTTKVRMNQASNQFDLGLRVYQKAKQWLVSFKGEIIPFNGSLELKRV